MDNWTSVLRRRGAAHVSTAAAWQFARAATSDLDSRKPRYVRRASRNKTEGSFDQPKGRDGADGVSRNVLAPCKGGLRRDVPSTELPGGVNRHGDYGHNEANEEELPQFDADVEEKKGERDGVLRQARLRVTRSRSRVRAKDQS